MGASPSREASEEADVTSQYRSVVRVSPDLLLQLAGQEPSADRGAPDGFSRIQPLSEAEKQQAAVEEALRSSRVADSALQHSRRVGDLLLKNEDEEVQRVTQYAEELLDHEYRAPMKPTPCEQARQQCLACYTQHPQDVLKCGEAVEAYKACADQAFRKFVGR